MAKKSITEFQGSFQTCCSFSSLDAWYRHPMQRPRGRTSQCSRRDVKIGERWDLIRWTFNRNKTGTQYIRPFERGATPLKLMSDITDSSFYSSSEVPNHDQVVNMRLSIRWFGGYSRQDYSSDNLCNIAETTMIWTTETKASLSQQMSLSNT